MKTVEFVVSAQCLSKTGGRWKYIMSSNFEQEVLTLLITGSPLMPSATGGILPSIVLLTSPRPDASDRSTSARSPPLGGPSARTHGGET